MLGARIGCRTNALSPVRRAQAASCYFANNAARLFTRETPPRSQPLWPAGKKTEPALRRGGDGIPPAITCFSRRAATAAAGTSSDFKALIGGRCVGGDESSFAVTNPATGEELAQCPHLSNAQVDEAISAAQAAFQAWRGTSMDERREMLSAMSAEIAKHAEDLAVLLTLEQGKPLASARAEVNSASRMPKSFLHYDIRPQVLKDNRKSSLQVHRRPLGVVAAIVPWNFPLSTAFAKIYPAILAGNAVTVKPSPYTPLTMCRVSELLQSVVPPGLFQVAPGGDAVGRALASHPGVAKVSFTGSVAAGKQIQATCAQRMARTTLELGGNDAAIVCKDADILSVAPKLFQAAMANSGQVCIAVKRIYVYEDQYDAFCDLMVQQAEAASVGNGMEEGVRYGPLCNAHQLQVVAELVEDAGRRGAQVLTGGRAYGPGYFYLPTVLKGLDDSFRVVKEEQFGPVIPILSYTSETEAVERANASKYGLGGSVWSQDHERAATLAGQLECGVAWVNQHMGGAGGAPFGGFKESGIGREGGEMGLHAYTETQTVAVLKSN